MVEVLADGRRSKVVVGAVGGAPIVLGAVAGSVSAAADSKPEQAESVEKATSARRAGQADRTRSSVVVVENASDTLLTCPVSS